MAKGQLRAVIGQLHRLIRPQGGCRLTDAQLVESFVSRRDEASFEVLVWRHATMVLGLCQRILHDTHAAEDAFQATFLVLARKAASIGKRDAVASWLYKVASRVALRLRARAARRGAREEALAEVATPGRADDVAWRDLRPVLDEEIDRLPEKYRAPFVLCYLQGHTNEEAAEQLRCPKGTILSRLARGRERLRSRLARRGLSLSAAGMITAMCQHASAAVPLPALVSSTIKAAMPFAAGQAAAGLVAPSVAALTEGVLRAMFLTKTNLMTVALLAVLVLVPSAALLAGGRAVAPPASGPQPSALAAAAATAAEEAAADEKLTESTGKVIGIGKDGKSFTLEFPPVTRGEDPKKIDVPIGEKTQVSFFGVGPGSAKLTEGYTVRVWRAEGKDVPAFVLFTGTATSLFRRPPDLSGRVVSGSTDGKVLTVQVPPRTPEERERREPVKIDVRLTDKTVQAYSWIAKNGTKPVEGYTAEVWLVRGSKDEADKVAYVGHEPRPERGVPEKQPEWQGKVTAVGTDGKSFTVETIPVARGTPPAKQEIKIDDKTQITYLTVPPEGDKPSVGYQARVWLADVTKDNAARIVFQGTPKERWEMLEGKVAAVAADGKSITLEFRSRERRDEAPKKVEYKLSDKTNLIFYGVGPDGTRPAEGQIARVYLEDGAKDVAVQVEFISPGIVRPGGRR
jgi:RNA polymerase sigma factor (sigma-70 family)